MDIHIVVKALENCLQPSTCKDCPWLTCNTLHDSVAIPEDLAQEILEHLRYLERMQDDGK